MGQFLGFRKNVIWNDGGMQAVIHLEVRVFNTDFFCGPVCNYFLLNVFSPTNFTDIDRVLQHILNGADRPFFGNCWLNAHGIQFLAYQKAPKAFRRAVWLFFTIKV